MRILVVEDDRVIGDGITAGLTMAGYASDWVEDAESAETALETNPYDMIILDIGLPDGSGLDVLAKLRASKKQTSVLVLTAYDDTAYKVKALDAGADDYLIKPFKLEELQARIRAVHRRVAGRAEPILMVGAVTLDPATHKVTLKGTDVKLGPREFAILRILMERAGRIVTKAQLEDSLYGWDKGIESNTVEVHVHGLRRKLGREFIETVRRVGYRVSANDGQ